MPQPPQAGPAAPPPAPVPAASTRPPARPRGRRRVVAAAAAAVAAAFLGVSVGGALTAPGTDSTSARLAEWGRSHGLSGLVDQLERTTYRPPAVGGAPPPGSPLRPTGPATRAAPVSAPATPTTAATASTAAAPSTADPTPAPPLVSPLVSPALPGEGTWRTASLVRGLPAVREAFLRPDPTHTQYTAGVAWMDPSLVRFVLHPGTQEPGHGPWSQPPSLAGTPRPDLLAAFNSGFRLDAARGGFFEDGRTAGTLRDGAASLVVDRSGTARVVAWGRDARMSPDVVAVRQNLDLLVDGGQVAPGLDADAGGRWGATLGDRYYVWRSGLGQTATGALVYVAGDRLSAATLAELLRRAGAVRAMELDINPQWTSFVTFPAEEDLLPDMQRSPTRYDTTSSRDFVAVLARTP